MRTRRPVALLSISFSVIALVANLRYGKPYLIMAKIALDHLWRHEIRGGDPAADTQKKLRFVSNHRFRSLAALLLP
jgi:hypothetical protein